MGPRIMNLSRKCLLVLVSAFVALVLTACDRPMEKAGRAIDNAGDGIRDAVK